MQNTTTPHRRVRSFVRRNSRRTPSQDHAYATLWPIMGLALTEGLIDLTQVFGRTAPCFLEIGFGTGQSLLAFAKAHPEYDVIGIETYRPGIGSLLMGVEAAGLTNIRIYEADAVDVLQQCIPSRSLAGAQIFFPDPWQKRRHHERRLIQPAFIQQLAEKMIEGATLDVATDWEDYAAHMLEVLERAPTLTNVVGPRQFAARSLRRPVLTKFESRAMREGRVIHDLQYRRQKHHDVALTETYHD